MRDNLISKFISDYNNGKPIEIQWLKKTILEFSATLNTKEKIKEISNYDNDGILIKTTLFNENGEIKKE